MTIPVINPALDLPAPEAIQAYSHEELLQAWLTALLPIYLRRVGREFDVGSLKSEPTIAVSEAMSLMRVLDRARVNDAYRALRLALATGADLEGLAADRGVRRLVYVPADPVTRAPAVMEPYESLRLRTWLKMQTWGLGSPFGVEYAARTAALGAISDARCYDFPGEGRMLLVLLPAPGRTDPFEPVRAAVGAYVMDRRRRPGSIWIDTTEASIRTLAVSGRLGVRRGASRGAVKTAATKAVADYLATRRRIGALVPQSALDAKAHVADVVYAHLTPATDTAVGPAEAAEAGPILLEPEDADD